MKLEERKEEESYVRVEREIRTIFELVGDEDNHLSVTQALIEKARLLIAVLGQTEPVGELIAHLDQLEKEIAEREETVNGLWLF